MWCPLCLVCSCGDGCLLSVVCNLLCVACCVLLRGVACRLECDLVCVVACSCNVGWLRLLLLLLHGVRCVIFAAWCLLCVVCSLLFVVLVRCC